MTSLEVKESEFNILSWFKDVCDAEGLSFYLSYGTCLGAVRHGDFIPWDDDVDVCMPREDYEKFFLKYGVSQPGDRFAVKSYRDSSSYHPHLKIVDTRTLCHEVHIDSKFDIGLWVDVFPLEEVFWRGKEIPPRVERAMRRNFWLRTLLALSVSDASSGSSAMMRILKRVVVPFARLWDPIKLAGRIDENARSVSDCESNDESKIHSEKYLLNVIESWNGFKCILPWDAIFPTKQVEFHGECFPAPRDCERYLTHFYGDWRKLPPVEDRHPHFVKAYRL